MRCIGCLWRNEHVNFMSDIKQVRAFHRYIFIRLFPNEDAALRNCIK